MWVDLNIRPHKVFFSEHTEDNTAIANRSRVSWPQSNNSKFSTISARLCMPCVSRCCNDTCQKKSFTERGGNLLMTTQCW